LSRELGCAFDIVENLLTSIWFYSSDFAIFKLPVGDTEFCITFDIGNQIETQNPVFSEN